MKSNDRARRLLAPLFFLVGPIAIALAGSGCVVETGPDDGAGGSCYPNLILDYEIQNAAGGPVTCAGAGAVTVQATVDGVMFPVSCPANSSAGSVTVPLQGLGTYNATIDVYGSKGNPLAPAQSTSFSIGSCGDTETQTPAILVVSPPAAG
ncbi:MAG TPA: hypothetical protein VHM31_07140 [Polyangia bacterium]|nr:hypothetical protein [Polyangia bacterium]